MRLSRLSPLMVGNIFNLSAICVRILIADVSVSFLFEFMALKSLLRDSEWTLRRPHLFMVGTVVYQLSLPPETRW